MQVKEDVGICRLARFLAVAILMYGTTASAGEIIITIDYALYYEYARVFGETKHGNDDTAAEHVEIKDTKTYEHSGHEYQAYVGGGTGHYGPICRASLVIEVKNPGLLPVSWAMNNSWEGGSGHGYTDFDFVVYNTHGTDTELIVPIIAEGTLTARARHTEHGTVHDYLYKEPKVEAVAMIEFYHHHDPLTAMPIAWEYAMVSHDPPGAVTPTFEEEKKPWLLTVPVLVGKNPGARAYYTVRMNAWVIGLATAFSPDERTPERLFYSKVEAWAEAKAGRPATEPRELNGRGTVDAAAAVDPFIYIDPTWEHADKFAVVFPDNLTPQIEEWDDVVFADGFERGFTLLWSSTVP